MPPSPQNSNELRSVVTVGRVVRAEGYKSLLKSLVRKEDVDKRREESSVLTPALPVVDLWIIQNCRILNDYGQTY